MFTKGVIFPFVDVLGVESNHHNVLNHH